jgi:hypothetical protein
VSDAEELAWEADYEQAVTGLEEQQAAWLQAKLDAAYRQGYEAAQVEAYRMGYNAHAESQQHWQDTHGAYRQHGEVIGDVFVKYNLEHDSGVLKVNQHGEGENP